MTGEFYAITFPWPDEPTDDQFIAAGAALAITVAATPTEPQKAQVGAVMQLLSARIEQHNSAALLAEKQEAAARWWGDLKQRPSGGRLSVSAGRITTRRALSSADSFYRSGAAAILSRNRPALALAAEDDD